MTATETFTVGDALPRIRSVSAHDGYQITVTWDAASRDGRVETIDLAPALFKFKVYARLRDNPDLFRSVHVVDEGFAVAWGDGEIDMASTTIEELASQAMTPADFASFVKRNGYSLDGIAAELGISRRQAAYFQNEKSVPRYIALACAYLDKDGAPGRLAQMQHVTLKEQTHNLFAEMRSIESLGISGARYTMSSGPTFKTIGTPAAPKAEEAGFTPAVPPYQPPHKPR